MRPPLAAADTNSSFGVRPTVEASYSSSSAAAAANLTSSQLSERTSSSSSSSSSEASSVAPMPGEDTPLFPLMTTPMPKRMSSASSLKSNRHGNSPPRGGSAGPTMFFLRSEDEMFPDSNASQTTGDIDEEEEEERDEEDDDDEEEETGENEIEEGSSRSEEQVESAKAQDSMFGVQSLASHFSTSDGEDVQLDYRPRMSMPHVTPLSTAVVLAAMQHRNYFSSTPLSQPLTPIHLHSPARGHSPIATDSTTDVIDISGLGTPRSLSVGSFRQLSSDDEDERTSVEADIRSSSEVRGRLGLSPKRDFLIEENRTQQQQQQLLDRVSASFSEPQFIMPSVQIPPRRPFTITGRYLGKLKIMVVGSKGVGKTSFIRSLVQSCMDIVHVDDPHSVMNASSSSSSTKFSAPTAIRRKSSSTNALHFPSASVAPTESIEELHASTRARPSWWIDIENSGNNSMSGSSRNLRRRKSNVGGPPALQRNICFIDTPGYDFKNNELLNTLASDVKIKEYIEALLWRNMLYPSLSSSSPTTSEMDLLHVLSGDGGLQVDLVLHLFPDTYTSEDIEFTKRLAQLTNVCPVIAKSDQLGTEELSKLRQRLSQDLAPIKVTHLLVGGEEQHQQGETSMLPYAISSAPTKDDNMDASLMMSPDYIPPLVASDLSRLVSIIFDPDTTAWLRHTAAHRFIQWRRTIEPAMSSLPITPSLASSSSLYSRAFQPDRRDISFPLPSFGLASNRPPSEAEFESSIMMNSFENSGVFVSANQPRGLPPVSLTTRLRMNEPLRDSEPPGQNNLARWAVDLQRSLRNERDRLEQVRSEERRVRIMKRISNQEAEAGTDTDDTPDNAVLTWRNGTHATEGAIDPLGLILMNDRLRQGGVLILKGVVVGVVLGKLIAWCAENLGVWEAMNRIFPGEVGPSYVCSYS